jgi:hypothetical protein
MAVQVMAIQLMAMVLIILETLPNKQKIIIHIPNKLITMRKFTTKRRSVEIRIAMPKASTMIKTPTRKRSTSTRKIDEDEAVGTIN